MRHEATDVLVIGSGFGAAPPALRLSAAGARVLMLEKGPDIVPERDFRQTQDPRYLLKYLKGVGGDSLQFTYAEGLGGGSGFYELISLRAPSRAFAQVGAGGRPLWPGGLDRRALDPYYAIAEKMLNINQIAVEDVPQSGIIFSKLLKNLGYTCDRAPYAVVGCRGDGYCATGCVFGAKQTLHGNYLAQARRAGLELRPDCEALSIRPLDGAATEPAPDAPLADLPLRYEIVCRDVATGGQQIIRAKLVVLGGGTVGTARLLLNSREFLPRLGRHVGRNVCTNGSVKAAGIIPDDFPDADMFRGRSHPGMISYQFLESHGLTISSNKPLPLFVVAAARLVAAGEARRPDYWGRAHQELMQRYRRRMIAVYALGLTPPNAEIRLRNDGSVTARLDLDDATRELLPHHAGVARLPLRPQWGHGPAAVLRRPRGAAPRRPAPVDRPHGRLRPHGRGQGRRRDRHVGGGLRISGPGGQRRSGNPVLAGGQHQPDHPGQRRAHRRPPQAAPCALTWLSRALPASIRRRGPHERARNRPQ